MLTVLCSQWIFCCGSYLSSCCFPGSLLDLPLFSFSTFAPCRASSLCPTLSITGQGKQTLPAFSQSLSWTSVPCTSCIPNVSTCFTVDQDAGPRERGPLQLSSLGSVVPWRAYHMPYARWSGHLLLSSWGGGKPLMPSLRVRGQCSADSEGKLTKDIILSNC